MLKYCAPIVLSLSCVLTSVYATPHHNFQVILVNQTGHTLIYSGEQNFKKFPTKLKSDPDTGDFGAVASTLVSIAEGENDYAKIRFCYADVASPLKCKSPFSQSMNFFLSYDSLDGPSVTTEVYKYSMGSGFPRLCLSHKSHHGGYAAYILTTC